MSVRVCVGECGKNCGKCPIFDVCGGCSNTRCLIRQCCLKGVKYSGLTSPSSLCAFQSICPRGTPCHGTITEQLREFPEELPTDKSQPMLDLPGFTPIIKLGDEATWFWDSVPHDVLIARLGEALGDEGLLKKVKAKGIHDFLNFQGKVILSTIMPDEMLDRLSKEKYVELLDAIRLDAAMILDCYTYIDDPLVVSWQQLFKSVGAVAYLADHTDIPLIGLVKGANTEQLSWCLEYLFEMNFHTLVLPRRELVRAGDVGKRLFGYVLTKIRELGYELLNLLIYGKPFLRDFIDDRKIHFASLSWYLRAEAGIVYVGDEVESLENNILYECDCEFCRGRKWNELITDVRSMALHNLAQIIDLHKGWRRQ